MARAPKKATLGYISDDSTRRSRYKKRLKGLMKKADEMATLCDVDTCVVVYGEDEAAPVVFPSPAAKAVGILKEFNGMPELGHCKKTMDQEGLLTQRIARLREQIDRSRRECHDSEIRYLLQKIMQGNLPGLVGLTMEQLVGVGYKVDELLKSMAERTGKTHPQPPPPAPCVTPALRLQAPAQQQD
ncbi:Agamous-like MADS-box protein AGL80 [Hordeum vulgare]|uniref:MADS-box domain-containing protein n=1 Tax=Hordeum vulgare subsp. vulgare TaxID=112509 RepID=A0A8I6YIE7_HORVV|nr:Agamous-like MADS-box protein AGL80 [Hordeum vulgare]